MVNPKKSKSKKPYSDTESSESEVSTTEEVESSEDEIEDVKKVKEPDTLVNDLSSHAAKLAIGEKQAATTKPTLKAYKQRLFVGEADFSFANAYLKKKLAQNKTHIGHAITATEYMSEEKALAAFGNKINERIDALKSNDVTVRFQIDATQLHEQFPNKRFHRIHFNFPHHGGDFNDKNQDGERILPNMLRNFFSSAKFIQRQEDRVHVALPKIVKPKTLAAGKQISISDYQEFYDAYNYSIFEAAALSGYKPIFKHWFCGKRADGRIDIERYPEYKHSETGRAQSADIAKNGREWVFEKTNLTYSQIKTQFPTIHAKKSYGESHYTMPTMATDYESSDGEVDSDFEGSPSPKKLPSMQP